MRSFVRINSFVNGLGYKVKYKGSQLFQDAENTSLSIDTNEVPSFSAEGSLKPKKTYLTTLPLTNIILWASQNHKDSLSPTRYGSPRLAFLHV